MKRNYRIWIVVNKEEKEKIKKLALMSGHTLSSYIRFVVLNTKPIVIPEGV